MDIAYLFLYPAETTDSGRMILHRGVTPEQRNDFFDQTELTIMVYSCRVRHINSTYVAQTIPLFRNARIRIEKYQLGRSLAETDFQFRLTLTKPLNNHLQGGFTYSLPIFHDHLGLYIHQGNVGYQERSSKLLVIIVLPISLLGTILCLSVQLALNVTNARRTSDRIVRPAVSIADAFIWIVGVFAQQGSAIQPNSSSGMIVILVALYFSSIMYCTYLTEITSQLSVDVDQVHDLQTLLSAKEYRVGFVGNFTTDQTFIGRLGFYLPKIVITMT
uniref:Ionotropic glutamate receptor C-terminal domain-containing protein n=1 Tax=Anopheles maculatus TaxID=74869 RepID=A0A182STT9_9DIPT